MSHSTQLLIVTYSAPLLQKDSLGNGAVWYDFLPTVSFPIMVEPPVQA